MLSSFDFATPILAKFSNYVDGKSEERTYELINEHTETSDNGFMQMVKFYGKNNSSLSQYLDVDGEGRELHCELILETNQLSDDQDVTMGVLYSKMDSESDNYDGLKITFNYQHANVENTVFKLEDVHTTKYPDIWRNGAEDLIRDVKQDWSIQHSEVFC